MQSKATQFFTDTATAMVLAVGVAILISDGAKGSLVPPMDPVFRVSMPVIFRAAGAMAMSIGFICLFARQTRFKLLVLLWFALNFAAYQLGLMWAGGLHSFNGYWSNLPESFGVPPIATQIILMIIALYLLLGSCAAFWVERRTMQPRFQAEPIETIKMFCALCDGHIVFSSENLGRKIPCPHCKATITLMRPKNVKTACPSCGGNIEFPLHGLRQTIACPHCAEPITLGLTG